ncbi:glutamate--tRNA ligase family protein, partial [Idiomarina sp. UBA4206]
KRIINTLVEENKVTGWDDPRVASIAGLRRRGYTPDSIREFCRRIGVTKMDNQVEMSMLEACIRDDLNANAPRAMAVMDPVKIVIENYPEGEQELLDAPNHPNDPEMGSRQVTFSREIWIEREDFRESANKKFKRLVLDKEVRLRNAYVIRADRVETDDNGEIQTIYCHYDAETLGKDPADGRKVKGVIHWVSAETAKEAEFRVYDRLFQVPNPAAEEDLFSTLNPESLVIKKGFVEANLANAKLGENFQFERLGYYCMDQDADTEARLIFNQTVGLRDSWAKIEQQQATES